ncbi:MAG: thioredoxin family protein [Roseibium sp.]
MRKQRKSRKPAAKASKQNSSVQSEDAPSSGRRNFLRLTRNLAIGAGVLSGGGYVFAQNVISTMNEHDLTRVGNGRPTVVQIHDPNCSLCLALQKETRKALKQFQEGRLDYVVANIRSAKGKAFANRYGVQHVTLMLFDDKGELQEILQGQRGSYELRAEFSKLLAG